MPQEPIFPVGTAREILQHANHSATDGQLSSALSDSTLFLKDLPDGLDTLLGSSKAPLSIGQLRKVALARSILKDASLLILDEPSASVDDVSETSIAKLISLEASKGRMILLISHRQLDSITPTSVTYVGGEE